MGEFIGGFSTFLDVQIALVVKFYGVIYALEEVQKMGLYSLNVILRWFVLRLVIGLSVDASYE